MTDEKRTEHGEVVIRMYGAMGGALTVVRAEDKVTGRTIISESFRFTMDAEREYDKIVQALTAGL